MTSARDVEGGVRPHQAGVGAVEDELQALLLAQPAAAPARGAAGTPAAAAAAAPGLPACASCVKRCTSTFRRSICFCSSAGGARAHHRAFLLELLLRRGQLLFLIVQLGGLLLLQRLDARRRDAAVRRLVGDALQHHIGDLGALRERLAAARAAAQRSAAPRGQARESAARPAGLGACGGAWAGACANVGDAAKSTPSATDNKGFHYRRSFQDNAKSVICTSSAVAAQRWPGLLAAPAASIARHFPI